MAIAEDTATFVPPRTPETVSPEAQRALANAPPPLPATATLEERRRFFDNYQTTFAKVQMRKYPVTVENQVIAGVPVRTIKPGRSSQDVTDRILIDVHGGGFLFDSGSLTENVAIAALTHTTVIAILYRLAPEHPFPAAVDDAVAVYKEILKTYSASHIGLYGTSAGAILTAEAAMRLRKAGLPLPAALGFFSGSADLSLAGDSEFYFSVSAEHRTLPEFEIPYVGSHDPKDSAISPFYGDLKGFPPTLCITSTRDVLLSDTALFHRALLRAGVDARLVVFEAMPHAFWSYLDTPESDEAFSIMANFLLAKIK
jgi:acetyl esterase/lipase